MTHGNHDIRKHHRKYFNVVSGFCVHLKNTSRTLNEITTLFEFGQIGGACYTYDDMIIHVVSG